MAIAFFRQLLARGVDTSAFDFGDAILILDRAGLDRAQVKYDSAARAFAEEARRQPGVARADLFSDIQRADTVSDVVARRWRHAIPPDMQAAVVVTLNRGSVWGSSPPGVHGSPYDDDCHVPLLFYGPGIKPGRYDEQTSIVDLAPTLAQLAGVSPIETIDGHVLRRAIR